MLILGWSSNSETLAFPSAMSKKTVYLLYLSSPKQKYGCLAYTDGSTVTLTYSSMAEIKKVLISLTTSLRLFVYLFKLSLMHIQVQNKRLEYYNL